MGMFDFLKKGSGGNPLEAVGRITKGAFNLKKNLDTAKRQKKLYKEQKGIQDTGFGKMLNPEGISKGEAERMRAGAAQSTYGATRGLEADVRRGMAGGPRGGSQLAALKILSGQRNKGLQGVEDAISGANIDRQKLSFMQGQGLVEQADPVVPTVTKTDAYGAAAGELFGAAAKFKAQKDAAAKKKAEDVADATEEGQK